MMGGTGLEPVTPACRSRQFAQAAWLSGICPTTERWSEPERTLVLAILATPVRPSTWHAPSQFGTALAVDGNTSISRPSSFIASVDTATQLGRKHGGAGERDRVIVRSPDETGAPSSR